MMFTQTTLVLGLAAASSAHFVLQIPLSLGFDDVHEATGPCGGSFNPADRSGGVTDWPIGGSAIGLLTTHPDVTFDIKAALLSDLTKFRTIVPTLKQQGVGDFCTPVIPGPREWVGLDAVLQIAQHAPDGILYQCAAIRFQAGPAGSAPSDCKNSTGVKAQWIPGTGGNPVTTTSSVVLPTTTSTSTISSSSSSPDGPPPPPPTGGTTSSTSSAAGTTSSAAGPSSTGPSTSSAGPGPAPTTAKAGSASGLASKYATSTVVSSSVYTVTSCAASVTGCTVGAVTTAVTTSTSVTAVAGNSTTSGSAPTTALYTGGASGMLGRAGGLMVAGGVMSLVMLAL